MGIDSSPLPPPFARTLSSAQPESTAAPVESSNEALVLIPVQYELYSNYANRPTVQDTMSLPSTLPPMEFRTCIAKAMGLEADKATLAYTIFGTAKAQPKCVFNSEVQVQEAIRKAEGFVRRHKTIPKGLAVLNLDPVPKSDNCTAVSTPSNSKATVPKSKIPGKLSKHESAVLQKTMRIKEMIVKLRARLRCQLCRGEFCFIDPRTGRHIRCSIEMITLWAKLHVETPAVVTLNRPPNHRLFDASKGVSLSSVTHSSADGPSIDSKSKVLGSTDADAIFVSDDSPPPVKDDSLMDVIDISSDSGSSVNLVDSDSLPDPSEIRADHVIASDPSLAQLLYELESAFPCVNFLSFHPQLESLGIHSVQDLAAQSVYWISDSLGMGTAQALVTSGAAMLIAGKDGVATVDIKGKGKAAIKFED